MASSDVRPVLFFLVFSCLLLSLMAVDLSKYNKRVGDKFLEENKEKEGVLVIQDGLQYRYLERGTGQFHPKPDQKVKVHYEGRLMDGTVFDSSYARGQPSEFPLNGVIKAWTLAVSRMVTGDVIELYARSDLAYGERGSPPKIGPNALLIFKIELISFEGKGVPVQNSSEL